MKKEKLRVGLFIAVAILQITVPLYMIWQWENVLSGGREYYWRTAPVDPYDALRGKYVHLSFTEIKGVIADGVSLEYGQGAYAKIEVDEGGYAYISQVSTGKPTEGEYLKVKIEYVKDNMAYVQLPFTRFYMREDLASLAERAYRESRGKNGAVAVRIKDGLGVVEELYIGDKTITEYLQENK